MYFEGDEECGNKARPLLSVALLHPNDYDSLAWLVNCLHRDRYAFGELKPETDGDGNPAIFVSLSNILTAKSLGASSMKFSFFLIVSGLISGLIGLSSAYAKGAGNLDHSRFNGSFVLKSEQGQSDEFASRCSPLLLISNLDSKISVQTNNVQNQTSNVGPHWMCLQTEGTCSASNLNLADVNEKESSCDGMDPVRCLILKTTLGIQSSKLQSSQRSLQNMYKQVGGSYLEKWTVSLERSPKGVTFNFEHFDGDSSLKYAHKTLRNCVYESL
jgi:hypothetical protein